MITAAILQPHYLPYTGFFNLIDKVDVFVFFDNVQFEARSWQNRNRIKTPDGFMWLSVPVIKKFGQKIKATKINNDIDWQKEHWTAIKHSYSKAKYFNDYKTFFENIYSQKWDNISEMNITIIKSIAEMLGLKTKFVNASELNVTGKRSELLVNICRAVGANHYISNIGSKVYMDKEMHYFNDAGISVDYMIYKPKEYIQLFGEYISHLSAIDVLFNYGKYSREIILQEIGINQNSGGQKMDINNENVNAELPAIKGGKPVREKYMGYVKHWVTDEDIDAVVEVLKSDWITQGPKTEEYEQKMAEYIGCKRVVATSSCTAALHICLTALGVTRGDEVITSDLTFAATPSVPSMLGAKPIPVDIYEDTFCINPKEIKKNITEKTKVIIPVHYAGQPCDMDQIMEIAKEYNLEVVEDAAHAISAEWGGKKIGTISKAACFSFHPIKNMTMGEGGIIATNDEEFAEKCKLLRLHGLDKYKMVALGYKYTINDMQAALGISQLKKLPLFEDNRHKYAQMYTNAFKDMPEIIVPKINEKALSSWHLYVIRLNLDKLTIGRDEFREALTAENVGTQLHFIPIHMQPYYQEMLKDRQYPATEKVYNTMMTLPLFPKMTGEDVNSVITAVKKIVNYYKK